MKKRQLLIPVLAGLIVGQIFAEGDRPLSISNTLRFGYDDNVDRTADKKGSAFIEDVVNLAFRAALSDRTDLIFKSKLRYRLDDGANQKDNLYPNIYAILTHSVSPRLLLQLSEMYKSGSKTSSLGAAGRYNYFENAVSFVPSYVLSQKDRLSTPVSYTIKRHDDEIDDEDLDMIVAGLTWKRDLSPQRTWAALNLRQVMVDYINRDSNYEATELTTELSHTFNQEWHGNVEVGVTYSTLDFPDYTNTTTGAVISPESSLHPFLKAGLAYEPSPRTRFTADISQRYQESNDSQHSALSLRELRFGAQHDFTAKIMGKATARFSTREYDEQDAETTTASGDEDRFDLDFRLQYKLNRINFLELGLSHRETLYDDSSRDWDQNMIDIGWRVEL